MTHLVQIISAGYPILIDRLDKDSLPFALVDDYRKSIVACLRKAAELEKYDVMSCAYKLLADDLEKQGQPQTGP